MPRFGTKGSSGGSPAILGCSNPGAGFSISKARPAVGTITWSWQASWGGFWATTCYPPPPLGHVAPPHSLRLQSAKGSPLVVSTPTSWGGVGNP